MSQTDQRMIDPYTSINKLFTNSFLMKKKVFSLLPCMLLQLQYLFNFFVSWPTFMLPYYTTPHSGAEHFKLLSFTPASTRMAWLYKGHKHCHSQPPAVLRIFVGNKKVRMLVTYIFYIQIITLYIVAWLNKYFNISKGHLHPSNLDTLNLQGEINAAALYSLLFHVS